MFAKEMLSRVSSLRRPLLFGMVHLRALPGAPQHSMSMHDIEGIAVHEATVMAEAGFDGLIVENMHDVPYGRPSDMETSTTVAAMTSLCLAVTRACRPLNGDLLFGVQMLAACNREAMSVAHVCGLHFVRAEGFVFAHVADEGLIDGCAASLLRHRRHIGAECVGVVADVQKKHRFVLDMHMTSRGSSHAITADLSVEDWAAAAEFSLADGVVITGRHTAHPPDARTIHQVSSSCGLPIMVGSGVTAENVNEYRQAHALIVGSSLKVDGHWRNHIDIDRVRAMRHAL